MFSTIATKKDAFEEKTFLAHQIKQLRELRGLTQKELGQLAGISQTNIARYEDTRKPQQPQPHIQRRLAQALGVPLMELLGEEASAPILHDDPTGTSNTGGALPERGDEEMRVARLCAAIHKLVKEGDSKHEIMLRNHIEDWLPGFYDDWDSRAAKEISDTIEILKKAKRFAARATSKRPA